MRLLLPAATLMVAACAGGPPLSSAIPVASDAQWRTLERPRVARLSGAPRVTVSEIILLGDAWRLQTTLEPALGLQELISAGFLRRADVNFVERRRYAEAADRQRRGVPRGRNAPAVGTSPGAELMLTGSWIASGDSAAMDLRLTHVESGRIVSSWRSVTPRSADPTSLARVAVGSTLEALRALGRLPDWSDPVASADIAPAPATFSVTGVSLDAAANFMAGVEAEDRYDWEVARRAYQRALEVAGPAFLEADVALARVARLRAGGTLGGNEP